MVKSKTNAHNLLYIIIFAIFAMMCFSVVSNFSTEKSNNVEATWDSHVIAPTVRGSDVLVSQPEHLAYIAKYYSSYNGRNIILTQNINLSSHKWVPIGNSSEFECKLYGNNYVISGLKIATSQNKIYSGLFGLVKLVNVYDLIISQVDIDAYNAAGTIVAWSSQTSTIQNCKINDSSILVYSNTGNKNAYVGGVLGYGKANITNTLVNNTDVYCIQNYVSGTSYVYAGGLVGRHTEGTIQNCANTGGRVDTSSGETEEQYAYTGGLVGHLKGDIKTSYNTSSVYGGVCDYTWDEEENQYDYGSEKSYTGGIAGYTDSTWLLIKYQGGTIENCYNRGYIEGKAKERTDLVQYNLDVKKQFANNVGYLWLYDLYIVDGEYTQSNGSGKYKSSTHKSYESDFGTYAYVGGIAGYASNTISNCYNTAKISGGTISKAYTLYYKWKANDEYHLLISHYISYLQKILYGNIVGDYKFFATPKNCYYSNDQIKVTSSLYAYQTTRAEKGSSKTNMLQTWSNVGHNSDWKIESVDGCDFKTYHYFDASDCSSIKFRVKYKTEFNQADDTEIFALSTGLSSTTLTDVGTKGIYASNLGNVWTTDSEINDGLPFIKDMYWL